MIDLYRMGGPLFMGILTIILIADVALAMYLFVQRGNSKQNLLSITWVKEIGIFGLVVGIFAQFIGLFDAFKAIEQIDSVSPALLAGGLKVSTITTLYGLLIFIVAYLLYFGLKILDQKRQDH